MNKNVVIGILAVAVIGGGAYYVSKNKPADVVNNTTTIVTPGTPSPTPTPTPSAAAGAPVVQTSDNPSVSISTAIVTGQVKPNGATTTYWYEYGETTGLGSRTVTQQIGSGFSLVSSPAFITGLKANTTYYYRLSANNRFATVNGTTLNFRTNNTPAPTGSAPNARTNNANEVSRTSAILNGAVNPQGLQTDFWFEYGTDNNLGNVTTVQSAGAGTSSSVESVPLSNLQPLTKYFFRINAQNQFGTVNGSILSFTTSRPAPGNPTVSTLSATSVTATSARLNGRVNPNSAETNYWFEYSLDANLGTLLNSGAAIQTLPSGTNSTDVHLDVTSLTPNTEYFYRLVGRNSVSTVRGDIMSFKTNQ